MTIIQLTPAQKLALSGFLSLLASAFVVTISAVYQYYAAGNVSVSALLNFALLTFFITFGKALHDHVPSRAREAIQSAEETALKAQEVTQTIAATVVPAVQQNQEAIQKVQETTQTIASNIVPVVQQNQEAIQKVQETTQTIASNIVPGAQQMSDTTQTALSGIATVVQPGQGATAPPQGLSVPLVVIYLPPGSSLTSPTTSSDTNKDQIATENLM